MVVASMSWWPAIRSARPGGPESPSSSSRAQGNIAEQTTAPHRSRACWPLRPASPLGPGAPVSPWVLAALPPGRSWVWCSLSRCRPGRRGRERDVARRRHLPAASHRGRPTPCISWRASSGAARSTCLGPPTSRHQPTQFWNMSQNDHMKSASPMKVMAVATAPSAICPRLHKNAPRAPTKKPHDPRLTPIGASVPQAPVAGVLGSLSVSG